MLSRRGLIGAGSLLTAAFVKDARAFVGRTGQPLLASPAKVAETMCWYDNGEQGYLLTVGYWTVCPPPPTWREFFISEGIAHEAEAKRRAIWEEHGIDAGDYDDDVDGFFWETRFDLATGPTAKAFRLLKELDLGKQPIRRT